MRVGIVGTGAIASKHLLAYKNIGYKVTVCTNTTVQTGKKFADMAEAEFVPTVEQLCRHPHVDYVDVCTLPGYRLPVVELCAIHKKHVIVEKPIAIDTETAHRMLSVASDAGIQLGVVSQRRFDDSVLFLKRAMSDGRLGNILQADAYVKWYRSAEYYSRPIKGSWADEGGGALINQGIHQIDLLLYLIGPVEEIFAYWRLGASHQIESEDSISALLRFRSGVTGVVQASTSLWPGYPERLEIFGTKGTAITTGDKLTTWDVQNDWGSPAPLATRGVSGASDPMTISILPFERQFLDFGDACKTGHAPSCSGVDGFNALQVVKSAYLSCLENRKVGVDPLVF
jgi:UDP-N-acetyl-2-amino-2-deoxyglucuronate dehydrogenase